MAKFCGQCGTRLNDTALFCGGCGAKVAAASAVAPAPFTPVTPANPVPQPGAYTPVASAYTSVESGFSSPTPSAAETSVFAPMNFTPAEQAPPEAPAPLPGGFAPVAFTPAPPPAAPAIPAAAPGGFAPVPGYTPAQAAYTPPAAGYAVAPAAYATAGAYPAKKSNTLVKVLVAVLLFLFVSGALALAGLWYAAQKIRAKAHEIKAQVLADAPPSTSSALGGLLSGSTSSGDSSGGFKGDPCRFLSKSEVSQAVGLQVIRTDASDGGCSYIAKGDPADVTSKHMAAMLGGMGADAQTQKMAKKFAGALFSQQEASDKSLSAEAATGEIPVLVLSFTSGNAAAEMKMNRAGFAHLSAGAPKDGSDPVVRTASGDLPGIGDEAFVTGGSMIMLRKGNTNARFMYISCPCNTDNIKPLAQMVASRL